MKDNGGVTPNWSSNAERNGTICKIPTVKRRNSVQNLGIHGFQVSCPRLFNSMPKNIKSRSLENFKCQLDVALNEVPDEPKSPGATNIISGRQTYLLIYQVARI